MCSSGGEALAAVVEAREAGKTRFIGYSGDNDAAAYAAGLDEVDVIEMSVNIADQANIDRRVLPTCRKRDVGGVGEASDRERGVEGGVAAGGGCTPTTPSRMSGGWRRWA